MANYNSIYTGTQIDEAVGRASVGGAINTELAKLSASLSNKVNKSGDTMTGNLAIANGNGYFEGGIFSGYGFLKLTAVNGDDSTKIQIETGAGKNPFIETVINGVKTATAPIATATPPTEYDLPLSSGVTACGRCVYSKTQDGIVTVHGAVNISKFSFMMVIATLPAGFRPLAPSEEPANYAKAGGRLPGAINVLADGPILAYQDDSAAFYCTFNISFVAGN